MRISYSQYNMYLTCGIKYAKKYIENIPYLSAPVLVGGKAVHKGIEINYAQKIVSKTDLPVSDLKDAVADEIERGFSEELYLTSDEKTVGKEKLRGQWKDLAVSGVEVYHRDISPHVIPIGVEKEFRLQWGDHILHGYMDVVDEKRLVRDAKTSKKSPVGTVAEKSQQLTMYTIAHKALYGTLPEKLTLDYVILANGRSRTVVYETKRAEEDMRKFLMRLKRVISGIQAGVFLPPGEAWACDYCQYSDDCAERL